MLITDILNQNARCYPEKVSLVERLPATGQRRELTWAQFRDQAARTANALAGMGVRKGDKVVQLMTNDIDWLPIYFGILYTGAWAAPPELQI